MVNRAVGVAPVMPATVAIRDVIVLHVYTLRLNVVVGDSPRLCARCGAWADNSDILSAWEFAEMRGVK